MKTILQKVLGSSPQIKVIEFLVENQRERWSVNEISNNTKSSYHTVKKILPTLIRKKLVNIEKQKGHFSFYRINLENPTVKKFIEFYWAIIKGEYLP